MFSVHEMLFLSISAMKSYGTVEKQPKQNAPSKLLPKNYDHKQVYECATDVTAIFSKGICRRREWRYEYTHNK